MYDAYNAKNDALTSVSTGGMTNSYSYSKDRLTGINVNGGTRYSFAYDSFGRTTQNKVGNGTDWKTLSSIQYNSAGLMSKQTYGNGNYYDFTYDNLDRITQKRYNEDSNSYNGDGQRISKTVNGTKTEYYYNGSILAGQKTGSNTLIFMYDNNGDAFGFKYNGTEYYYVKNLQNDITAITNSAGTVIANYYYDAWGNSTEITGNTDIANVNPLRYRSYYYDTETNLYYLSTRYYAPDMCRFLNADGIVGANQDILSNNLFAYCSNDPLNYFDESGYGRITNFLKTTWQNFKNSTADKVSALLTLVKKSIAGGLAICENAVKTVKKPSNIGAGTFSKQISKKLGNISKIKKVANSSAVGIGISVGASVVGDVIDQKPINTVVNNAMTELMFGVAEVAVGYCATSVSLSILLGLSSVIAVSNPFTLAAGIGIGAAMVFGFVVDYVPIGGMTIKDRAKEYFNGVG